MAQFQTLKDRESGQTVYPITSTKAVFDKNHVDLDTLLAQQKQQTNDALKDYPKKTDVTQSIEGKQDKLSPTTDIYITNDNIIGLSAEFKKPVDSYKTRCTQFNSPGYGVGGNNTVSPSASFVNSGLQILDKAYDIVVFGSGTKNVSAIILYDSALNVVKYVTYQMNNETIVIPADEIPASAVYFRASTASSNTAAYYSNGPSTFESVENLLVQNLLSEQHKIKFFCDLFNAYAINKGYARITDGSFDCKLNGLPLTYEEALRIIPYGRKTLGLLAYNNGYYDNIKTNFPPLGADTITIADCSGMCTGQKEMEVFVIHGRYDAPYPNYRTILNATARFFDGCSKLRQILGRFTLGKVPANIFHTCEALQDFNLIYLDQSVSFSDSPLMSLESVKYMIDNANNKATSITITVHADVYTKLTGDTTNEAAAALTPEELAQWQQVLTDAVEKNISFATV